MIEIRGGSVYFETGAAGGTFTGVVFMDDETSVEVWILILCLSERQAGISRAVHGYPSATSHRDKLNQNPDCPFSLCVMVVLAGC
jgi:hypothetical protein